MRYKIRTIAPAPPAPPIVPLFDTDAAKAFMKVTSSAENALIDEMVLAAMDQVERFTGQVLTPRELEMAICGFPLLPELISLPREPVTEILSITYTDSSTGEAVELEASDWRWSDTAADQLLPAWRQSWPVAAAETGSVRVRFNAGYEAGLCPAPLIEAVKKTVLQLYLNRGEGGGLSDEVQAGLRGYRPLLV